jgi:predicted phosphoribosyltransferase
MKFKDRHEAGQLLAKALEQYKNQDVVVYGLPRGGVIVAAEIARDLHAPLDLIITRKIGHPYSPEYAIAAIAEDGHMIGSQSELEGIDSDWLQTQINSQRLEAKRRRKKYLEGRSDISVKNTIAIIVDDGVATGLTIRLAILELKHREPKKIIVAVPVVPQTTAELIQSEAGQIVALDIPPDYEYLGAVGAYYNNFSQVEDEEVIAIMRNLKINNIKEKNDRASY